MSAPANGANPEHDAVYEAVFNLVGTQPTQTVEGLMASFPTLKQPDPPELRALNVRQAVAEMMRAPPVDPYRLEYEMAAEEEDLPTEEGEWLELDGKDAEELDEHGIPMLKLSRPSSGFILDGPGQVRVDNFTPEEGEQPESPEQAAPAYVPTTIARAEAGAGAGAAGRPAPGTAADGGPAVATGAAVAPGAAPEPGPVLTLQDELRLLHQRRGAGGAGAAGSGSRPRMDSGSRQRALDLPTNHHAEGANGNGVAGRNDDGADDDDDEIEVVMEEGPSGQAASSLSMPRRPALAAPDHAQPQNHHQDEAAAASVLPGEAQDTTAEERMWRAMQGAGDAQFLLEHMGLGGAGERQANGVEEEPTTPGAAPGPPTPGGAAATASEGGAHADQPAPAAAPAASSNGDAGQAAGQGAGGSSNGTGGVEHGSAATALALPGSAPLPGPLLSPASVSYEEVEKFSLDPDFDYDNCPLTRRDFPYDRVGRVQRQQQAQQLQLGQ